jgi:phospholipid/cholesterol/gamma-HCH transport system permease protein
MTKQKLNKMQPSAFRMIQESAQTVRMELTGDLTHMSLGPIWQRAGNAVVNARCQTLVLDTRQVPCCNGAGVGFLAFVVTTAEKHGLKTEVPHLPDDLRQLLERFTKADIAREVPKPKPLGAVRTVGKLTHNLTQDVAGQIAFLAQVVLTSFWLLRHPKRFRAGDFLKTLDLAGFQALGIVSLLGFLFGLIMAFSSAMPLRQFGVEVYVSDLVAYALVRVLGPFMTAIIVTGRTGSAYAAEIGTMKINDEINALKVMNLDPVSFLAIPRILATILVMPVLTLFANISGLIGSALVITSLGYTITTYSQHVQSILTTADVAVGLVKALVFGWIIGQIGCLRGLQTQTGAGSVGISTTRAVVSAIVLLVIAEGIFSVLLNFLKI